MPIATLDDYRTALQTQRELVSVNIASVTTVAGRCYDLWRNGVPQPPTPTVGATLDATTLGALGQQSALSGQLSIVGARFSSLNPGNYLIVDRLVHTGQLSGTVTGPQTVNLPTPALPRYTNGVGVMLGLTVYSAVGSTASTVWVRYTNQDGVPNRQSTLSQFGGTGYREASRCMLIPLQDGDTGVRSVESVELGATTGTAGAFGVTLFRPLYVVASDESSGVVSAAGFITGKTCGGVPTVENNACLSVFAFSQGTNAMGSGAILLDEN